MLSRAVVPFLLAACAPAAANGAGANDADPLGALARSAMTTGCRGSIADSSPVPSASHASGGSEEVAVYTAHPDDEAMYGGSTMAALVRRGRKVAVVVMSHGEGGRLLEIDAAGKVIERRDVPSADVANLRDREIADAVGRVGATVHALYPADANVDYGWTTSCSDALAHWDKTLPGGVREMLRRIIVDLRTRRPRIVVTLDPRDDPQGSHHGHHKAVGMLVELATRAAADPRIAMPLPPHTTLEVLTFAPRGTKPDVKLDVGAEGRVRMLEAYPSQFRELDDLARRSVEEFVVRWRAEGVPAPRSGSLLSEAL